MGCSATCKLAPLRRRDPAILESVHGCLAGWVRGRRRRECEEPDSSVARQTPDGSRCGTAGAGGRRPKVAAWTWLVFLAMLDVW